ncbi:aldehyde reductase [Flavobacterium sp. WLB]|uniref:SDR family oxidoreductase n=1 Tax=unclassified Flavobacterium TaxID=196869 RepID=UPI0006ABB9EA|nr:MULTISPECIES: aldehyde reductase [unclassified Flavobacterium]KOP39031.1 epimerase [Flavobacterium sp. VMW]OWU89314.1 epimerase [Flavobacterium sp. NLM]PUU67727.1 aldehyde reductase [Flavobacterium sp. WLB]
MTNSEKNKTVLVTGGSGFIAVHCILKLLKEGYSVKTTLRSLNRQDEVKQMLKVGGISTFENLSFIQADLSSDKNWDEAVKGCEFVLHVASPTPAIQFTHEDELINPAKDGVLRVLKASRDANVKRVVLTSAFGAVGMGHKNRKKPYTEEDWTNIDSNIHAYQKSKTIAEQTAWEFIKNEGGNLELSAVNPVGVMGPLLGADYSHSHQMIKQMLEGDIKACPKISSCYIDVRDVADLHLLAMTDPKANGERFLATTGNVLSMLDVAKILKNKLGNEADKVPTKELPNWVLKASALKKPSLKMLVTLLGQYMQASGEKAKKTLNWSPRSNEEAILATAESLLKLGLIKK